MIIIGWSLGKNIESEIWKGVWSGPGKSDYAEGRQWNGRQMLISNNRAYGFTSKLQKGIWEWRTPYRTQKFWIVIPSIYCIGDGKKHIKWKMRLHISISLDYMRHINRWLNKQVCRISRRLLEAREVSVADSVINKYAPQERTSKAFTENFADHSR